MRQTIRGRCFASTCISALAFSTGAVAQDQDSNNEELELEEIIVTAGRRSQSLQDVPAAVVAISPDNYKFKGLQQLEDVLNYVPGIEYTEVGTPGRGTIAARGVPQSSATPVFGIYIDDTPLTSNTNFGNGANTLLDGLLLDVERVEVIKGPQGTLFGATSVGGLLRYISRDPALEEFRASFSADVSSVKGGEWGETFSGRVSVPVIENKLGVTVAAYYQHQAGFVDSVDPATGNVLFEDINGGEAIGYSADVLFTPTEALEVRLKYVKQENEADFLSNVNLAGADTDEGLFGDYASVDAPGPIDLDFEIYSGTINYDFGAFSLTSTTSHAEYANESVTDFTAAFAGLTDIIADNPPGTTTNVSFVASSGSEKIVQEIRLTSAESDKFEWLAGFFYTNEETFNVQDVNAIPTFDLLFADFPSEYTEYAGFANATYYFTENFDVSGGIRISKNEISLDLTTSGPLAGESEILGNVLEDTVDTYLFAARYRVHEDLSLYARAASGYRPAQANIPIIDPFTGEDLAPPVVEADQAWSYEVGAKGTAADGRVDFDVALWRISWDNFQSEVSANGVTTGGNAVGGITAYGFESIVTMRPIDNFSITGNLGYTSSTLDEDEPGIQGEEGENVPNLPNWKGSLQWNYTFDVSGNWSGSFGGGIRYIGGFNSAFRQSVTQLSVPVDGRTFADVNIGISNGNVHLGLYATNLFDNRALLSRFDEILGGAVPAPTGVFERPRTIGANIRVDF